jgi:hypothetical protein
VELSHGSGTCLSQESKGSGTLSGSKTETNDAASTSRSKSIQPNNLDLVFDKSNDQQKMFLLNNKWDIPSSFVFPLTAIRGPKFAQSFIEFLTNACSELLNKTQHKQKTPFSDSEYLNH